MVVGAVIGTCFVGTFGGAVAVVGVLIAAFDVAAFVAGGAFGFGGAVISTFFVGTLVIVVIVVVVVTGTLVVIVVVVVAVIGALAFGVAVGSAFFSDDFFSLSTYKGKK